MPLAQATSAVKAAARDGDNLRSGAGPVGGFHRGYMTWIRSTESTLIHYFNRSDVERFLLTPRYYDARRFDSDASQIVGVIRTEMTARVKDLEEFAAYLQGLHQRFGSTTVPVLVPDTNVFLHFTFFDEAPWPDLVSDQQVRLVVPLVVVEELDRLKHTGHDRVADRARKVIRRLDELTASAGGELAHLPGRGTIEIIAEDFDRVRLPAVDAEIVRVCGDVDDMVPTKARVVTGDLYMKTRARSYGVDVIGLPESWELRRAESSPPQPS
jgi:rRNA-processing protein FCF1